jgi:hypothetical protein
VQKLKKQKIFPDMTDGIADGDGHLQTSLAAAPLGSTLTLQQQQQQQQQPDYEIEIEPLVATLRERLEMAAMLDASEQSTSTRSVQLWKLLDEELESSRDHKMRTAMHAGRSNISRTMKCALACLCLHALSPSVLASRCRPYCMRVYH